MGIISLVDKMVSFLCSPPESAPIFPQNIVMYHYTGKEWVALPTTVGAASQGKITFTAISPSFSLYAISAQPGTGSNQTVTLYPATIGDLAPVSATEKKMVPARLRPRLCSRQRSYRQLRTSPFFRFVLSRLALSLSW